ncbi:GH92 family glycosyl hydrolase [Flammeovirgaceae bacterium SG7u.111]|nr:GH92 family glycosyl hydrolase [Flammeovirgaceae bacterium SG7u.132]WPO33339.1 GH92 family glycosyl hydrolase [Flammeovirgaceae bacterium SG7u.111]
MKMNYYILLWMVIIACTPEKIEEAEEERISLIDYVDPLIGTGNASTESTKAHSMAKSEAKGQTFPAVGVPNGMTNWTPQTQASEKKCLSPYYYTDSKIQGFRGSHWMTGSCTQDYGSFTLMPMTGKLVASAKKRASSFSHQHEKVSPASYEVWLESYGIQAKMTGLSRSGFFEFEFDENGEAWVVVEPNSDKGLGYVKINPEKQEISGYNPVHRIYQGQGLAAGFSGHFVLQFDQPFEAFGTWEQDQLAEGNLEQKGKGNSVGAYVKLKVRRGAVVRVKAGTSFTSVEKARENLEIEIPSWDYEKVQDEATEEWELALADILVEGKDEQEKTVFYSALYHARLLPRVFSDVDGSYPAFDGNTEVKVAPDFDYYADFSMWDTYRALHPLLNIVEPRRSTHMAQSLVLKAEQGNWLPIFPAWNSYTAAMIGDHAISMLGDTWLKGNVGFDIRKAYKYMRKNAFEHNADFEDYKLGKGRRALDTYLKYNYLPMEEPVNEAFHKKEQVSRTLEYAYDDFVLAQVARSLDNAEDYAELIKRAENYKNVYDSSSGYMRGKHADGRWVSPFDPNSLRADFITEGSPNQYTWYVPHDVAGLISLMGGEEPFTQKLDTLFEKGYYWHGNEPGHQTAYMYAYAGQAWKTQKYVRNIMAMEYGLGEGGLSGNEDSGQMSAWYVFSAMGFYPVCPGMPNYVLGSPLFEKTTLSFDDGSEFVIEAKNNSTKNIYIQSATLNGRPYDKAWISHFDLVAGGVLVLEMGSEPNSSFGAAEENLPPSMSTGNF